MHQRSKLFTFSPVIIALLALLSQAFFSGAASYYRTSLQDMTTRAGAVAEVQVLARRFPEMPANEFQRTHVDVSVLRTLKGSLPEKLTLDLPGGVRGNLIFNVPDSAEFMVGERAMVFIKEPEAGHFMVQDLGLGKFGIVSRDNKQFVESAICPRSLQGGQESTNLLTKSIPYDDFCSLIAAYATNDQPQKSPVKLALALRNSPSHRCDPNKPCQLAVEARAALSHAAANGQWFNAGLCAVFVLLASALVVLLHRRRQQKTARVPAKVQGAGCGSFTRGRCGARRQLLLGLRRDGSGLEFGRHHQSFEDFRRHGCLETECPSVAQQSQLHGRRARRVRQMGLGHEFTPRLHDGRTDQQHSSQRHRWRERHRLGSESGQRFQFGDPRDHLRHLLGRRNILLHRQRHDFQRSRFHLGFIRTQHQVRRSARSRTFHWPHAYVQHVNGDVSFHRSGLHVVDQHDEILAAHRRCIRDRTVLLRRLPARSDTADGRHCRKPGFRSGAP